MMIKSALSLALILCYAANALAHDLWVEKTGGKYVVMFGHLERLETYNPEWVREIKGFDGRMKALKLDVIREKGRVSFSSNKPADLVTLVVDSGYWVKTEDGLRNISKRGVAYYLEATHFIEPVKSIFRWSERFSGPVGAKMEILPLKNPLTMRPGDTLPIKVLFEGNPVAGAVVTSHGELTGIRSGKDGRAEVMISGKGLQVFAAKHKVPLKENPDADLQVFQAYLSFEVR
jgi:nickel transport protein